MANVSLRRSFVLFHLVLGTVILVESLKTVIGVIQGHTENPLGLHLALLATIETVAAVLFLVPRTLKVGGVVLIGIFLFAMIVHGIQHELDLLVFAAGVLFVSVHGSAYSKGLPHRQQAAT